MLLLIVVYSITYEHQTRWNNLKMTFVTIVAPLREGGGGGEGKVKMLFTEKMCHTLVNMAFAIECCTILI